MDRLQALQFPYVTVSIAPLTTRHVCLQLRGKKHFLSLAGLIPGPNKAKDLQPYLERLKDQFLQFKDPGFLVWDAHKGMQRRVQGAMFVTMQDNPGARETWCQNAAGICVLGLT